MTLQKIADAVGVNVATAQRAIVNHPDFANANSEIVNERGQLRPMHYAARAVDTPVRMPPTAPRTGAALRLPVFSSGSTAMRWQNGLQRLAPKWPGVCVCGPFQPGDTGAQFCQLGAQRGNVGKPSKCGGNRCLGDLLRV